ncbi:calcyphosin-2 isoform X2 [Chiloscyllium plagiosum]|uniref:calcyphosin-2 isoform X2 n=1 Tax=Chiloscyllium plagiosum TaxID=36176 RepID=UPI001CB7AFA9|nr:calcyphosin-2 isoform X2 [Chiloscyllium plagiosum]XP_043565808.1 calcyphosin-2 isoform X2 [Chiloscyllium plagiosum]XP_043565809.1 calcyphosin-2 isoform X2 [Chiloscyllium plagiosum]
MDLEVKGIGTTSRHSTRQKSAQGWRIRPRDAYGPRPDAVPALDLRRLGDSDGENDLSYTPVMKEHPRLASPDSSSTVSWGTPFPAPFPHRRTYREPCPIEEMTIPENLPAPSESYKLKYQQYKEEMKMNYKEHSQQKIQRSKSDSSGQQPTPAILQMQESPADHVGPDSLTSLDEKATLQQCYTSKPFSMEQNMKRLEAEDLAAEKKKQAVVEQVLVDQLSRAVISDPGQDVGTTDLRQQQTILPGLGSAPLRFKSRKLHQTRVKTSSTLTENVLSNKLRFDARIISRNGRDACRELIGFFFAFDKSLTVYEHRHFGKNRTKALPFIQRGIYCHQCGWRKGRQYDVGDFYVGTNLTFLTSQHVSIPASIQEKRLLILRIIEIDETAKISLLTGSNPAFTEQEIDDRNTILSVQGLMKEKLVKRGVRTMTGLVKFFHQHDQRGGGVLSKMEIKQGLTEFHLELADKDFESVWLLLDQGGDGEIDYYQFIQVIIGEMNEFRKAFVRKAYMKLDPNKTGSVSVNDISKFYNGRKHPKVLSGECSEQQIRTSFLDTLQENCINSGEVTYIEFEAYYEGISLEVANDEDFANIMRNCWAV